MITDTQNTLTKILNIYTIKECLLDNTFCPNVEFEWCWKNVWKFAYIQKCQETDDEI